MSNLADQLDSLRRRIVEGNDPDMPFEYVQRLAVTQTGETFNLEFYGDPFEEAYLDLLNTVASEEVSPFIRSLFLAGPDEGANGTQHWDIEPLVATDAEFSRLESFSIRRNQPADHNRPIVGSGIEEGGLLARLLAKSPQLQELTVPSAPNEAFFSGGDHPIRSLAVDAGYDTQGFIGNFAASSCFPELRSLEWGEFNETYRDDYLTSCTSLDDYRALFRSSAFRFVSHFVWRNPICTQDEISGLKKQRPDLQFLIVHFTDHYV